MPIGTPNPDYPEVERLLQRDLAKATNNVANLQSAMQSLRARRDAAIVKRDALQAELDALRSLS